MVTYTVHEQGNPASDRIDRAEELAFVKDGFNYSAAIFGPFWMLANGLWLAVLGYVAVAIFIGVGMSWLGLGGVWPAIAMLGLHLMVGAEADSLKRMGLERSGWQPVGTVVGRNASECERRFFETWLPSQPLLRRDGVSPGAGIGPASLERGPASEPGGHARALRARRWWPFGA